jgi:hypothetical protein
MSSVRAIDNVDNVEYAVGVVRVHSSHAGAVFEKGSVESTHKVPTSHYHTKHCHAVVAPLGGLTHWLCLCERQRVS